MEALVNETATTLEGVRVLVVEDSYFVAEALSRMLRELGCEVVGPAPTVAAGLQLVSSSGCDIALLDINLGAETAEGIARALVDRGTPFMFITGYSSPRLLGSTFSGHRRLLKPVTPMILRDALHQLCSRDSSPP